MSGVSQTSLFAFAMLLLCACGGGSQGVTLTPMPTQNPSLGAQLLPASNGVASGAISSGATLALVGALSGSGDRSDAAAMRIFATTTIEVGSGLSAQPTSQLRQPQMLHPTSEPSRGLRTEAPASDDRPLKALLQRSRLPRGPQSSLRRPSESTIPPVLNVGSTVANIWVRNFELGGSAASNILVPATLEAQTAHGNIWIDNTLLSGPNASHSFSGGAAAQSAAIVGQDFEISYTSDTTHFASPDYPPNAPGLQLDAKTCDATGQPTGQVPQILPDPADRRINVMLSNSASGVLGDGVGGYFSPLNYASQSVLNCFIPMGTTVKSNEAPMIFVLWNESLGAGTELNDDLIGATAHELQHLINFVNHSLLPAAASDPNFSSDETSTNNEGLSTLAQDFAIHAKYPSVDFDAVDALSLVEDYLAAPGNVSVTGFIGLTPGSGKPATSCRGCYGGVYLFQRYLYDRFGGDRFTRAMETSGQVGFANLAASCACHETAAQLLQEFFVAMAADSIGVTPSNVAYQFGSLNLKGTYPSPIVEQPRITLRGLNAFVVPNGGTAVASAPLGGAAFFSVTPPGGVSVPIRLKDANPAAGFSLTGALVQR